MEAVANDTFFSEATRQSIELSQSRLAAMETCIEAGNLPEIWRNLSYCINRCQVMRLVRRSKANEPPKCFSHGLIHKDGTNEIAPTMHDTMPNSYWMHITEA